MPRRWLISTCSEAEIGLPQRATAALNKRDSPPHSCRNGAGYDDELLAPDLSPYEHLDERFLAVTDPVLWHRAGVRPNPGHAQSCHMLIRNFDMRLPSTHSAVASRMHVCMQSPDTPPLQCLSWSPRCLGTTVLLRLLACDAALQSARPAGLVAGCVI